MSNDGVLTDHPARQRAREEVLVRFRDLSWQDQYKICEDIQRYFKHSGPGSEALRELRERNDCVEAVVKAAHHLGMAEGEVPGVQAYDRARIELGLDLSSATIIRRWGVWREVVKAARGEKVSLSARQRAHLRAAIRQRANGEEWLTGLREWLASRPPPRAGKEDYSAWAEERNERLPDAPPVASATSVCYALALPWAVARRVAERDLSLVDAQAQHLARLKREGAGFVGVFVVSLLHGVSMGRGRGLVRTPGFPAFAFELGHSQRAWHLEDVEAHHQGQPFPPRTPGELQEMVFNSAQIRQRCGLSRAQLVRAIEKGLLTAPRPAGRVAGQYYWWRCDVERWVAEDAERVSGCSACRTPAARRSKTEHRSERVRV